MPQIKEKAEANMYQIDFQKQGHVHFIGIGGISMSGLAEILMEEGFAVSGSDSHKSELTEHLEAKGARVFYGQRASNIRDAGGKVDVAVYTAAVHEDNPEYQAAAEAGIPMVSRAQLLGQMMRNYRYAAGIAGTHGKTTTTSMAAEILMAAEKDPTISVGGILHSIGGNIRVGGSDIFVTEACEYTDSFLSFFPNMAVILNIEEDHLDYFKDINHIRSSFRKFAEKLPENGVLVINSDIDRVKEITEGLKCRVVTVGRNPDSDYSAGHITYDEYARDTFDLLIHGEKAETVTLGVPGEHNVYNALAAVALCRELGVDLEHIKEGLANFAGTDRRFEKKGEICGVTIIDDYAHHPREIAATLATAKNYPHRKLWCVFQPHTYTRTKVFLDEFAQSLAAADEVVLADIFAARETDDLGISSADIAGRIEALGTKAHYFSSFDEIETFILEKCVKGDLLITMGAGDIVKVGENLLGK